MSTHDKVPVPPHGEQTPVPEGRLAVRVRHCVPRLAAVLIDVPALASAGPEHRLSEVRLQLLGVPRLGVKLDLHGAHLPVEYGLDNSQGVVDRIFDGQHRRRVASGSVRPFKTKLDSSLTSRECFAP